MEHIKNPITGEVRYVTHTWARWLKRYGWRAATFDEFMQYQLQNDFSKLKDGWQNAIETANQIAKTMK